MRTATILFVLLLSAPVLGEVVMDAAELDRFGEPLESAYVRLIVDNSVGTSAMTGVRFRINYAGEFIGISYCPWSDPANPWFGAPGGADTVLRDGTLYCQGRVFYPPTKEWGPCFSVDPTPDDPPDPLYPDDYVLLDTVPAGLRWDVCVKLLGTDGSAISVFASPARGVLAADGGETVVYDDDPMPQTVPGPTGLILLALGGLCVLRRRR